jgi:hypothetical protein
MCKVRFSQLSVRFSPHIGVALRASLGSYMDNGTAVCVGQRFMCFLDCVRRLSSISSTMLGGYLTSRMLSIFFSLALPRIDLLVQPLDLHALPLNLDPPAIER